MQRSIINIYIFRLTKLFQLKLLQSLLQQDLVEPRHVALRVRLHVGIQKGRALIVQFHRSLLGEEKQNKKLKESHWNPFIKKESCSHPGPSPNGGKPLLVLVGLHLVLSSPGRQVEGGHHGNHLLEARGRQGNGDGGCRGQSQAHGPATHQDGLLEARELHGAPLPDDSAQRRAVVRREVLRFVKLCFSQGLQ